MIPVLLYDLPGTVRGFAERDHVCALGSDEAIFDARKRTASMRDDPMEMGEVRYRPRDGQIHEGTSRFEI